MKSDLKIVSAYEGSGTTTISLDLSLRLHDVQVNGVPLDVGPRCRTVRPFQLKMTGRGQKLPPLGEPSGYFLSSGGELNGKVTVPPFTGCGVGEDLDRIFTASVSGTVDLVRQNQGVPCAAKTTFGCTADSAPIDVPSPPK